MLFFKLLYNTDNTVYLSLAKPPIPPIYVLDSSGEPPHNLWLVKAVFWLQNLPFLAVLWLVKPVKSPSPTAMEIRARAACAAARLAGRARNGRRKTMEKCWLNPGKWWLKLQGSYFTITNSGSTNENRKFSSFVAFT